MRKFSAASTIILLGFLNPHSVFDLKLIDKA